MARLSMRGQRKQQFLETLKHEIKALRETKYQSSIDDRSGHCTGMLHTALILETITGDEFQRLSDLAISAAYYRRMEQGAQPYTWRDTAPARRAAA